MSKRKNNNEDENPAEPKERVKDTEGRFWIWVKYADDPKVPGEYFNFPASVNTIIITQKARKKFKYVVYQEETCPDTGRLHLQGFCITEEKIKHSALCHAFPNMHFEMRYKNSTNKEASDYCKKKDSATGKHGYEGGELEEDAQGKRTDLERVAEAIQDGETLAAITRMNPVAMMKYSNGISRVHKMLVKPTEREAPDVLVIYGPTNTGKSSIVRKILNRNNSYYIPESNNAGKLSFEDYTDQQAIWIDDFAGASTLGIRDLLLMLDRGQCKLPGRNRSVNTEHTLVCITSNLDLDQWGYSEAHTAAIARRISVEIYADYKTWDLIQCKQVVPQWLADAGSLNSSNSKFRNPAVELLKLDAAKPQPRNLSGTSRNFILPTKPIAVEEEEEEDVPDGYFLSTMSQEEHECAETQIIDLTL